MTETQTDAAPAREEPSASLESPGPGSRSAAAELAEPVLVTAVATEEEFDWTSPFERTSTSVRAARALPDLQAVFERAGVRPVYLVDYPIASQTESVAPLSEFRADDRCEIGAHLHPWVSPPFDETVSTRNSFPGNLPRELERQKLRVLCERIGQSFGVAPRSYQAGRYGLGPHTAETLAELGFEIDMSPSPGFDFRAEGGPDYSRESARPSWTGPDRGLLTLPVTGAFVGFLARGGPLLHAWSRGRALAWTRAASFLARVGALERMRLTPEGLDLADLQRLTRALLGRGQRTFVLSLHSPSAQPGCTPYVQTLADRERFFGTLRDYYAWFFDEIGGTSSTAVEYKARLGSPPQSAAPRESRS